jgi:hypothetical protein
MKSSTKRLLVFCFGIGLFVGYFVVADVNPTEPELEDMFLLTIIGFFTVINFIQYVKDKRKEELESR